jgi:CrcB protein
MTLLLVLLGGAVGAPLRYLTDLYIQSRHDSLFPWGTFTVNVAGSALFGFLAAAAAASALPSWALTLAGTGFCGALTTFSTFGFETVRLLEERATAAALLNAGLSLVVGLLAAIGGWALADAMV